MNTTTPDIGENLSDNFSDREKDWVLGEYAAVQLSMAIHEFFVFRKVELVVSGSVLYGMNPDDIERLLVQRARLEDVDFDIFDAVKLIQALKEESLHPCRIDLATLTRNWVQLERPENMARFFMATLGRRYLSPRPRSAEGLKIILVGFGRIARILTRVIGGRGPASGVRIAAVVVRPGEGDQLARRAHLLANDTEHGRFQGTIQVYPEFNMLRVNGNDIEMVESDGFDFDLKTVDSSECMIIDTTGYGVELLSGGFQSFAATYTIPDLPLIVHGVNQYHVHELEKPAFCLGSDSAAAVLPVLRALLDEYDIRDCFVDILRPFTNDQNLLDNIHRTPRMGRSAVRNLVPSDSNLPRETAMVLPEFAGRLAATEMRVPIPLVSHASIRFDADSLPSAEELNRFLKQTALKGDLRGQLEYSDEEDLVSSDIAGNPHCCVIDSIRTFSFGGRTGIQVWYDNEYGYVMQVLRMLQEMADLSLLQYG